MKSWRPLLLFFSMLVVISMACTIMQPNVGKNQVIIQNVLVSPLRGSGDFTGIVVWSKPTKPDKIQCYHTAGSGKTVVLTIDIVASNVLGSKQFPFNVTEPGSYSLVCIALGSGSSWSDEFRVPATLTITASSDTMTYGGTVPTIKPAYSGFVAGDTALSLNTAPTCSTTATSTSPVGSYPSSCSGAVDVDYDNYYTAGSVNVTPATLTITAFSDTMTYGGTVPTIKPAYSGFVAGDTALSLDTAPTCSTTATSTSPVGSYPSSCSGAVGANYTISYTAGSVSVTPATLTTLVLNGTFELPESEGTCTDGTQWRDPSAAVFGNMVLTVDYTTGLASATLQGSGQATVSLCDWASMTITRTVNGATLSGTLDPSTNALAMTGDVPFEYWSTCWIVDETRGGICIAGGETQTYNITLNGSIDPAHSIGAGKIQWTGNKDWGNWQVP